MTAAPPDFDRERALRGQGHLAIAGVDEVGRGPLAGPVTAAAVVLDPDRIPEGLDDSKRLSPQRRAVLAATLSETVRHAIVHVSVEDIDRLNILRAAELAMRRAVVALAPDFALIDGNRIPPDLPCPAEALVGGDRRSLSIAAASILAKVSRDRLMVELAQQHPGYGWERNAGYPTSEHKKALQNLGATPHHRRSFTPVRNILWQEKSSTR